MKKYEYSRKGKKSFQLFINSSLHEDMVNIKDYLGINLTEIAQNGIRKELDFLKELYGLKGKI